MPLPTLVWIKFLISATTSFPFPPKKGISSFCFWTFCLHINLCISEDFILSNKVDLSQAISALIHTKIVSWKSNRHLITLEVISLSDVHVFLSIFQFTSNWAVETLRQLHWRSPSLQQAMFESGKSKFPFKVGKITMTR